VSELPSCHCKPDAEAPCGPDSDCINRLMFYECHPAVCPAGERCLNQRFQLRQYPAVKPFRTDGRGWGLLASVNIEKVCNALHTTDTMASYPALNNRIPWICT